MMLNEERGFEDVLENNFSPETSEEEKNAIHAIVRHMKRLLNWNIVEDDNLFDKERGPEIVRDLIFQFNDWKSANDRFFNNLVDYIGMPRLVISVIAKLCFYYWIRDSQIVSEVLTQVYDCDGHFSNIFTPIMNQNVRSIWSSPNHETRQKEYLTIVYFLTHAHRSKQEFSGVRFVDLRLRDPLTVPPVFLAAIFNKPQLLLLLLRHGAIIDRNLAGSRLDNRDLDMSMRYLIRTLWTSLGAETEELTWDTKVLSSTVNEVRLCLRFFLRGIGQIPMGALEFPLVNSQPGVLAINNNSHDFIRSVSERGIVRKLVSRYFEPSELRHLCRLTIRDALNRNWNLPFGVFNLPLPRILQIYLNLSRD